MKEYIFFAQSIKDNGGGQIYYLNKIKHLRSLGWVVQVISRDYKGEIVYNDFLPYKNNVIPEIGFSLCYFTKKDIRKITTKILTIIGDTHNKEIVIESNWIETSEWAEVIARKIEAKHVIYLLSEQNKIGFSSDFLRFKLLRNEVSSISTHVTTNLFQDKSLLDNYKWLSIPASCYSLSTPQNVECPELVKIKNSSQYDCIISYFGRIQKMTIKDFNQVMQFSLINKTLNIGFIVLGYNSENEVARFDTIINNKPDNLNIFFLPMMQTLPKDFFNFSDVIIASAGCAMIAAYEKAITITIDTDTDEPIGILGITTGQITFSNIHHNNSLYGLLCDILIVKKYKKSSIDTKLFNKDFLKAKEMFLKFISFDKNLKYYDFSTRRIPMSLNKNYLRMYLVKLFGVQNIIKYRKIRYHK